MKTDKSSITCDEISCGSQAAQESSSINIQVIIEPEETLDTYKPDKATLSHSKSKKIEFALIKETSSLSMQTNIKALIRNYRDVYSSKTKGLMIKLMNFLKSDLIDSAEASNFFPQFSRQEVEAVKVYLKYKKKSREFTSEEDQLLLANYSKVSSTKELLGLFPKRCLRQLKHRYHYLNDRISYAADIISTHQEAKEASRSLQQLNEKNTNSDFINLPYNSNQCNNSINNLLAKISAWVPQMKVQIESLINLNNNVDQELVKQFNILLEILIRKVEGNAKPFEECKMIFDNVNEGVKGIESLCCSKLQNILLKIERSFYKKEEKAPLSIIHLNQMNLILRMKINQIKSIAATALELNIK